MAYSKRSKSKRRSRPRRPVLAVRTASKRVAVARRSTVMKLSKQVRALRIAKYGSPQVQRQSLRNIIGGNLTFAVSTTRPAAFCLEAISTGNQLYQCAQDGALLYTAPAVATFIQQIFPGTAANVANAKFDLQINRNAKSQGVASTYLYKGSSIDVQLFASNFNGWFHCYKVTPRASVTRITDQERRLPFALPCFIHMGGGGDSQYDQTSQFFSIKKVWSKYFNTLAGVGTQHLVYTNNLAYRRIWCPASKLIRGTDIAGVNLVSDEDIATRKQQWLVFTATSNDPPAQDRILRVQLQRSVHWRDSVGSK